MTTIQSLLSEWTDRRCNWAESKSSTRRPKLVAQTMVNEIMNKDRNHRPLPVSGQPVNVLHDLLNLVNPVILESRIPTHIKNKVRETAIKPASSPRTEVDAQQLLFNDYNEVVAAIFRIAGDALGWRGAFYLRKEVTLPRGERIDLSIVYVEDGETIILATKELKRLSALTDVICDSVDAFAWAEDKAGAKSSVSQGIRITPPQPVNLESGLKAACESTSYGWASSNRHGLMSTVNRAIPTCWDRPLRTMKVYPTVGRKATGARLDSWPMAVFVAMGLLSMTEITDSVSGSSTEVSSPSSTPPRKGRPREGELAYYPSF